MPTSVYLLLLLALVFGSPSSVRTLNFSFDGFTGVSDVLLYGTARLIQNGIVQLTDTVPLSTARVFHSTPIPPRTSFSTAFTFAMVPESPKIGGHGLAFALSPTKDYDPSVLSGPYMGLFNPLNLNDNSSRILAVEFDSVLDPIFNDKSDNHVGINLNGMVSKSAVGAAYYTENGTLVNVTLRSKDTIQAWVDYDSAASILNVTISPSRIKPKLPLLSYNINLSAFFLDSMYVGFSCSTGLDRSVANSHYLLGWSFNTSGQARSLLMTKAPDPRPTPPTPTSIKKSRLVLAIVLSTSISSVLLFGAGFYMIKRLRDRDIIESWEKSIGPHRYTYKELNIATKGFNDKELLGRGGFGQVYKGVLPKTKTLIAVKRVSQESRQGLREFLAEIATIGRVRHRNVTPLLGWCRRHEDLLLVYDYMPNGSLDRYLFDQPIMVLAWEQRLNVIKGVPSALLYLHEGWEQVVIHRDVKSSNVLLDSELNGRLGDFGLARVHEHGANLATTRMIGTLGYLAPELTKTGKATTSTDVFAFWTLLLEVVCGRRPIDPRAPQEELVLAEWVWENWVDGRITSVVDTRLGGRFDEEEATTVLKLGLMCSCDAPVGRPDMRQVVSYLTGEMEVPEVLAPTSILAESVEGSKGFRRSFRSSEFDEMGSNREDDVGWCFSSPTPLVSSDVIEFSQDGITSSEW